LKHGTKKVDMPVAIVTDSACDLPPEIVERLHIHVIPNVLVIDGQSFLDGQEISRQEFYERLPQMKKVPTTSAPSPGTFQALYESLFKEGYEQIISIHVPNVLSAIFSVANLAAQPFDSRVKVIDSGMITLGLGFQALAAAEEAAKEQPLEKILATIEAVRQRVHVIAMLDSLEYVRRSGRVSWAQARIGSLLDIKPFLRVHEGNVLRLGEARTRHKGTERLLQMLQDLGPLQRLAVLHTNAEKDALLFQQQVKNEIDTASFLVNVTTVIGTHVGPNGLGFAAVTR
jgi:DegV family protein with EDD domain